MVPIKDGVLGGGGNPTGTFSPLGFIVVMMKTSSISTTSLLEQASFCKTTFQPNFFKSSKKEHLCHLAWKYERLKCH